MSEEVTGIIGTVLAGLALIGTFIARWSKTNKENPWWVRLSTVFDATQVIDSTRKLDD